MLNAQLEALENAAAQIAGATAEQAGQVFGASVPALRDSLRQAAEQAGIQSQAIDGAQAQQVLADAAASARSVFARFAKAAGGGQ